MSSKRGFRLTEDDIAIFTHLHRCHLAVIDHLVALTGRTRTRLTRRLVPLVERGYLYRTRFVTHSKYVYTLNKGAVGVLVERGVAMPEALDKRIRLGERSPLFLSHDLMATDVYVALELACRRSEIRLPVWVHEGQDLKDKVRVQEGRKRETLPVEPDRFFALEDTRRPPDRNRFHFFLEADRSTSATRRFQQKVRAYWHYRQDGLFEKRYGVSAFRVVTVTKTLERAGNLCRAAREVLPAGTGRFYYFAPVEHFSWEIPERVWENIFLSPRDFEEGVRYRLIPPSALSDGGASSD